eukprot:253544_1
MMNLPGIAIYVIIVGILSSGVLSATGSIDYEPVTKRRKLNGDVKNTSGNGNAHIQPPTWDDTINNSIFSEQPIPHNSHDPNSKRQNASQLKSPWIDHYTPSSDNHNHRATIVQHQRSPEKLLSGIPHSGSLSATNILFRNVPALSNTFIPTQVNTLNSVNAAKRVGKYNRNLTQNRQVYTCAPPANTQFYKAMNSFQSLHQTQPNNVFNQQSCNSPLTPPARFTILVPVQVVDVPYYTPPAYIVPNTTQIHQPYFQQGPAYQTRKIRPYAMIQNTVAPLRKAYQNIDNTPVTHTNAVPIFNSVTKTQAKKYTTYHDPLLSTMSPQRHFLSDPEATLEPSPQYKNRYFNTNIPALQSKLPDNQPTGNPSRTILDSRASTPTSNSEIKFSNHGSSIDNLLSPDDSNNNPNLLNHHRIPSDGQTYTHAVPKQKQTEYYNVYIRDLQTGNTKHIQVTTPEQYRHIVQKFAQNIKAHVPTGYTAHHKTLLGPSSTSQYHENTNSRKRHRVVEKEYHHQYSRVWRSDEAM